jgi:hypothetical protein
MGGSVQFRFAYGLAMSAIEGRVCLPRLFPGLGVSRVSLLRAPKRRFSTEKRVRGFVFLGLLATLVLPLPASGPREERLNEYQAKASFLAAFPKFVEWQPDDFSAEESPFLFCVFGDFSFPAFLRMSSEGLPSATAAWKCAGCAKNRTCALATFFSLAARRACATEAYSNPFMELTC